MSTPDIITQVKQPKKKSGFCRLWCCIGGDKPKNSTPTRSNTRPSSKRQTTSDKHLLPPLLTIHLNKPCLILDLDETLVHSSFKPVEKADFIIPVEIEEIVYQVYVLKRPHVDEFMRRVGEWYEIVVFTASLAKYADPVLDLLDKHKVVTHRLFREHCTNHKGNYVKDLGRLGRELRRTIIIDNSPASYMFHPENAISVQSWFDDEKDTELHDLIPILEELSRVDDVIAGIANLPRDL
eukprot:TRINITY_DN289_c0_g2_i2.p1 TRINITY_DN289_c0_g2~~TRINITY_DN289_c0_g2_i2.p1  ORF type:complete len:238 (-),score=83.11 TRINITY_DN289_c0_g2_i2:200-913(-)